MKSKDVMSKVLFCCTPSDSIEVAARLMRDHDIGSVPVVNDCTERKLLGIVTDRDICVKAVSAGRVPGAVNVSEIMTKWPATCLPEDPIEACEEVMRSRRVRRVPIVDGKGVCLGIVSQADVALRDSADHAYRTLAAVSQLAATLSAMH